MKAEPHNFSVIQNWCGNPPSGRCRAARIDGEQPMKPTAHIAAFMLTLLASLPVPFAALAGPGAPDGWYIAGSRPGDYEFGTEHIESSDGKQSAYIKAKPGAT